MVASPALKMSPQSQPTPLKAMDRLRTFLEERRRSKAPLPSFEEFENKLHALVNAVECDALGEELERFDVDMPVVEIEGVPHRQVVRCEATYFERILQQVYAPQL